MYSQTVNLQWAKQIGNGFSENSWSVCLDASGNVYATGSFSGTVDFDPGPGIFNISSAGNTDNFILKLDASGNFVWVKTTGGVSADAVRNMFIDAAGNIYTTGTFTGTSDFDPGVGTFTISASSGGVYVLKLNASGNFSWAKKIGGISPDQPFSISADVSGNVITTGYFFGSSDFDPGPGNFFLNSFGSFDIFISKLDASGNFVWVKQLGGTSSDFSNSITTDASGNVYTTGGFQGTADFDPGIGSYTLNASNGGIFISKLDGLGNFIWAKQMGGSGQGYSIYVDVSNNVYTTGRFSGIGDFDPGISSYTLNATTGGVFISKLDGLGNFIWAKQMGGNPSSETGNAITVDVSGNVYTTGYFQFTDDFDPGVGTYSLTSLGNYDVFISKLDPSGNFLWAEQIGGSLDEISWSMALNSSGDVYTRGSFSGVTDFDPGTGTFNLLSAGGSDAFIHKLCQGCPLGIFNINNSEDSFSVYPNPTNDKLIIIRRSISEEITSCVLCNSNNEKMNLKKINDLEYDIKGLANGIYFLYIWTNENFFVKKIIIQN